MAFSLANVPVFAFVQENKPWSKLELLASLFQHIQYAPGEVVFAEGDPGHSLYLLMDGNVQIQARDGDGNFKVMGKLSEGDCFGELSLMKQVPRTATATAQTWTTLYELDKESFEKFLQIAPELKEPFTQVVQARTATTLRNLPLFASVHENKPWSKLDLLGELAEYTKVREMLHE